MLEGNKIESLPTSLGNLQSLTDLDLRNNKLNAIPDSIEN